MEKLPPSQPVHPDSITDEETLDAHPVLFESIDASAVKLSALKTSGAAGPSGLNALSWTRLCTLFMSVS